LGKFAFADGGNIRLGKGTSSVCYLGSNVETGEAVAIKVYKPSTGGNRGTLAKFRRHVGVLQEVQRPLVKPADEALWCEELARTDPTNLFLKLLDFSKDASGEPAQDLANGRMYIVTELADCTLKDMLLERSKRNAPLSAENVRKIAAEVMLAVAWLHSKGYVHLDVKPENIMMCSGRWKLIDMDGCVRAGTDVKLSRFLPRFFAPEFVGSVTRGGSVTVKPSMDAWGVGVTIAELVEMCPSLRAQYQEISDGQSHHGGGVGFLQWLGDVRAASLARPGEGRFRILLSTWLLMPSPEGLRTLAQSLNAPCFRRQDLG